MRVWRSSRHGPTTPQQFLYLVPLGHHARPPAAGQLPISVGVVCLSPIHFVRRTHTINLCPPQCSWQATRKDRTLQHAEPVGLGSHFKQIPADRLASPDKRQHKVVAAPYGEAPACSGDTANGSPIFRGDHHNDREYTPHSGSASALVNADRGKRLVPGRLAGDSVSLATRTLTSSQ